MPRRQGATTAPLSEKWARNGDGEWTATGRAAVKGRVRFITRKRRKRIGAIKASHKAAKRSN